MAKAALNMLTRTIGPSLLADNVFVSSVDTGWVTKMTPGTPTARFNKAPLSEEDGAARVLDPVFGGFVEFAKGDIPKCGVLFRNFEVASW